jgi:hypothetical protein
MSAGLSSIIVGPDDGSARMVTSVVAHPGVMDYKKRFKVAAAYQIAEAHRVIATMAKSLRGSPAVSEHPENGPRTRPDEMLRAIDDIPLREDLVPLDKQDFEEALASVPVPDDWSLIALSSTSDHGLVVEFPIHHAIPAMHNDFNDPDSYLGTALLTLSVRDRVADVYWNSGINPIGSPPISRRHTGAFTRYGSGLYLRLGLPAVLEEQIAIDLAAELNRREADGLSMSNLIGSWYAESGSLWFTAYYPNLLITPNSRQLRVAILADLVVSSSSRAQWAQTVLERQHPPPGDRKSMRRWGRRRYRK